MNPEADADPSLLHGHLNALCHLVSTPMGRLTRPQQTCIHMLTFMCVCTYLTENGHCARVCLKREKERERERESARERERERERRREKKRERERERERARERERERELKVHAPHTVYDACTDICYGDL